MRLHLPISVLVLLGFAVSPSAWAQPGPLDRAEILGRLAEGYAPSYLAQLVKTRGVSFSPSADFLDRVKRGGGDGILVERLSASTPPAGVRMTQPDRPADFLAKCAEWVHLGAAFRAEQDCRAAIDENPESPWPVLAALRALAVSESPSTQESIGLLRRAVALDATLISAHRALAVSDIPPDERAREMQTVEVLERLQPADDLESGAFTSAPSFEVVPQSGDLTPDARPAVLEHLRSLLEQHPDLAAVHLSAALSYTSLGDLEHAPGEIREALRLEPGNPELHIVLASFYLAQHETESELAEYREAARIAPYDNTHRRRLTEALLREGRADEAVREWRDFLVLAPLDLAASSCLVNLYLEKKDRPSAIAELQRSLKASSDTYPSEAVFVDTRLPDLERLAQLLYENREFAAAAEQYAVLLRFKPERAALHNNLGNALFAQQRCDEASREYREALRLQPGLPDAHGNLGNCLLARQKTDDAIAEYRQTIELDSSKPEPRGMLGVALTTKGELNAAIEQFQLALADDPDNALLLASLGHTYYLNKDYAAAIAALRQALALRADLPGAENELARIYATADDPSFRNPADALRLARHAVQISSQSVPEHLDTLAEALLLNGQSAEALKAEEEAADRAPSNARIQSRLPRFREAAQLAASANR
jgi:tetratricopeptide (TPR) repeat protein